MDKRRCDACEQDVTPVPCGQPVTGDSGEDYPCPDLICPNCGAEFEDSLPI